MTVSKKRKTDSYCQLREMTLDSTNFHLLIKKTDYNTKLLHFNYRPGEEFIKVLSSLFSNPFSM